MICFKRIYIIVIVIDSCYEISISFVILVRNVGNIDLRFDTYPNIRESRIYKTSVD